MFGWRDYREDGKQWVENGVENSVFHCLGSEGKKRGWKSREKIFLPGPPIFSLPTVERKLLLPWNYTNALSHLPSSQTQQLFWNQVKKKKNQRSRAGGKKERKHFLKEGEKERKEVGDKEIRTNVYGGKKKKKQRERAGEKKERMRVRDDLLERVWRKRKRRGGDRDNNVCGGDSIKKKKEKRKKKIKNQKQKCMDEMKREKKEII